MSLAITGDETLRLTRDIMILIQCAIELEWMPATPAELFIFVLSREVEFCSENTYLLRD
jgi:hypothetical protein